MYTFEPYFVLSKQYFCEQNYDCIDCIGLLAATMTSRLSRDLVADFYWMRCRWCCSHRCIASCVSNTIKLLCSTLKWLLVVISYRLFVRTFEWTCMRACIGDRNMGKPFCLAFQVSIHEKSTSTCLFPRREKMKTWHTCVGAYTFNFITHNILPWYNIDTILSLIWQYYIRCTHFTPLYNIHISHASPYTTTNFTPLCISSCTSDDLAYHTCTHTSRFSTWTLHLQALC